MHISAFKLEISQLPYDIYGVRHGEPDKEPGYEFADYDSPLTERGWSQATEAGLWLAQHAHISKLYHSTHRRAEDTAIEVFSQLPRDYPTWPPQPMNSLAERYTGLPSKLRIYGEHTSLPPDEGDQPTGIETGGLFEESFRDLYWRVGCALGDIVVWERQRRENWGSKGDVVVVAHQMVLARMRDIWLGRTYEEAIEHFQSETFSLGYCEILRFAGGRLVEHVFAPAT